MGQEQPQHMELMAICAVLLGRCRMCPPSAGSSQLLSKKKSRCSYLQLKKTT